MANPVGISWMVESQLYLAVHPPKAHIVGICRDPVRASRQGDVHRSRPLLAEHLGQVAELDQQSHQHGWPCHHIKRTGKEVRHPVREMEILSDFLVNLIRLPDRLGQFELLTFGRCDMEHIPCGRWLQLQQRLIDRLRLTGYLQAAAKTSEHLFFFKLAAGVPFQQVLPPTICLARLKRHLRHAAFFRQQLIDLVEQVEPADRIDEIAGHGRIIPLGTPVLDEALETVGIGIACDAAPECAQGILRRVHHRRLDGARDGPRDAEAAATPARLVGLPLHREALLVVLNRRLVRQHGLDEVRRRGGIVEPVPEVLLRHIVDAAVDQELHGLLEKRVADGHAVREHLG